MLAKGVLPLAIEAEPPIGQVQGIGFQNEQGQLFNEIHQTPFTTEPVFRRDRRALVQ